ncbi:hypothetical protein [Legionella rowbothamii]|uniref:hypothetical protein n=1 Tax=Legionella rowbothamii TaxID=96229 RepID=UPI001055B3FA|nr:hypothetical protein [Legionella rowbothamii]
MLHSLGILSIDELELVFLFPEKDSWKTSNSSQTPACLAAETLLNFIHMKQQTDYQVSNSLGYETQTHDQIKVIGRVNVILALDLFLTQSAHIFYLQDSHREHYIGMLNRFLVKSIQEDSVTVSERQLLKPILKKILDAASNDLQAEPALSERNMTLLVDVHEDNYLTHPFYQLLAQCFAAQKQQLTAYGQNNFIQWMLWKRNTDFATKILEKYQVKGLIPSCFVLSEKKPTVDGEALLNAIKPEASSSAASPSN